MCEKFDYIVTLRIFCNILTIPIWSQRFYVIRQLYCRHKLNDPSLQCSKWLLISIKFLLPTKKDLLHKNIQYENTI